jgi:alcohol dehydrogenase class IV
MRFDLFNRTRVVFGRGCVAQVGDQARGHGARALVVCGRSAMRRHGVLGRVLASLEAAGVPANVYDNISPDPKSDEVDEAIAITREGRCDVVIGLGGGSALDAAKAIGVAAEHGHVGDLIGTTLPRQRNPRPVIAIPTTAGSGAEVTKGSIITDTARNLKSGIRGDDVFPAVALVDPDLSATMPVGVAAETGFDALTHAVESYVARRANPVSEALSERAIRLIAASAAAAVQGDAEAQERMSLAALLGGLNVASASTCLPHRLQQAMGSVPHVQVSHGRGLATLYPAWLDRAYPFAADRFDRIAALLGGGGIQEAIGRLLEELGLQANLTDWGYDRDDIDAFIAGTSGNVENDPIEDIDRDLMRSIYERAL